MGTPVLAPMSPPFQGRDLHQPRTWYHAPLPIFLIRHFAPHREIKQDLLEVPVFTEGQMLQPNCSPIRVPPIRRWLTERQVPLYPLEKAACELESQVSFPQTTAP